MKNGEWVNNKKHSCTPHIYYSKKNKKFMFVVINYDQKCQADNFCQRMYEEKQK